MTQAELRLVVAEAAPVADGIVQLTLAAPGGGRLPSHPPGAHLGLRWRPGRVSCYSLTSDGDAPAAYPVSVLRVPGSQGGSAWAHGLRPGDPVGAIAPRSTFPSPPGPAATSWSPAASASPRCCRMPAGTAAGARGDELELAL